MCHYSLCTMCDMVLACDTPSCHDDHLCQIILISPHAGQSNISVTIQEHTLINMRPRTHTNVQGKYYMLHCHFVSKTSTAFYSYIIMVNIHTKAKLT